MIICCLLVPRAHFWFLTFQRNLHMIFTLTSLYQRDLALGTSCFGSSLSSTPNSSTIFRPRARLRELNYCSKITATLLEFCFNLSQPNQGFKSNSIKDLIYAHPPPKNFKILFRPLNHFRLSRYFRTFHKYVLGTPWIIKKNCQIFFLQGTKKIFRKKKGSCL